MYNRYIPQSDGTYRRKKMQENIISQKQPRPPKPPAENCSPLCEEPIIPIPPAPKSEPNRKKDGNIKGFLKNILPKDFDTGDLMIVLLLLLMAGDCTEDQNTALLTLALYFIM